MCEEPKFKTYSPRISIIYDKNENESEEDFFENITQTIKRIVEHDSSIHGYLSDEDFKNDCIGAIYNKNIIHRDRYVFFMSDKVIFCTPNRKWGLKLAGLIPLTILAKDKNAQDFVSKVVPYGKFNTNCGGTLSIKDQNIVFAEDFVGKKAIHSENLTKFLIWLVSDDNRTFIDLFKSEHTPIT